VAALLTTGAEGGSLPMAAVAFPTGAAPVSFLVEIEGAGLLATGPADVRRVEVYVYATSPSGGVHGFLAQSLRLDLKTWGEALLAGGIKLAGRIDLPPGEGSLRILVLDPDTLRYSLRILPVTQPAPSNSRPVLLPPLFPEPPDLWILARPGGMPVEAIEPLFAPLLVDGRSLPAALPVLASDRPLRTVLLGRGLPAEGFALRFRAENGGTPVTVPVKIVERSVLPESSLERLVCSFELPHMETGTWRVAATAGGLASTELTAAVLAESPAGREIAWSELRRMTLAETAPKSAPGPPATGRRRNAEIAARARDGYQETLQKLASGASLGETAARLAEAEIAAIGQAGGDSLGAVADVREAETRAAEQLGRGDPESLLPLALLHAELYRTLRDRREYLLAESSLRTAASLAEQFARSAGADLAGSLAARLLVRLAADLLAGGVETASRDLLDRALALDPRSEAARLVLAAHLEKSGQYAQAADLLARLLEVRPESDEARLRLAINLARTGRTAEAREGLLRLLAAPGTSWIQEVADQELVRLCLREGKKEEALARAREGLSRFPGQPQLAIQLAAVLDREGDPAARDALAIVQPRAENAGGSPRHRYTLWPADALDEADRTLAQHTLLRLPALARALASGALRELR
jgi:Tetratricopeptide repeat